MHIFKFLLPFPVLLVSSFAYTNNALPQNTARVQDQIPAAENTSAQAKSKSSEYRIKQDQQVATAKRAAEADIFRKSEAKKIASNTNRKIQQAILNNWQPPTNSTEQKARARITLTSSGSIQSILILDPTNPVFKDSIEKAILSSAPFELPENPDARRQSRLITITFLSK